MRIVCRPGYLVVAMCETPFKRHPTIHVTENFRQMCWARVVESGSQGGQIENGPPRVNVGDLIYIPRQTEPFAMDRGDLYGIIHESQVRVQIPKDDSPPIDKIDNTAEAVSERLKQAAAEEREQESRQRSGIIAPR